jgi:hypothetical protein
MPAKIFGEAKAKGPSFQHINTMGCSFTEMQSVMSDSNAFKVSIYC